MPRAERLGILMSLVMVGLAVSVTVSLPSREFHFWVLGSELSLHLSGRVQLASILIILVCAGTDALLRTHPMLHRQKSAYLATFWALPSLVTIGGLILLSGVSWWGYQVLLIISTSLALALVIAAQYRSVDPSDRLQHAACLVLNALTYAVTLILVMALYRLRLRSILSATGVLVVSSLSALELLRVTQDEWKRIWFHALLIGLIMGELTWALNYNSIEVRIGGALLVLCFYVMTGLFQQHLWGRLNRRLVTEFGIVWVAGLITLGSLAGWFRG